VSFEFFFVFRGLSAGKTQAYIYASFFLGVVLWVWLNLQRVFFFIFLTPYICLGGFFSIKARTIRFWLKGVDLNENS